MPLNEVQCQSHSEPKQLFPTNLCNRLYADGHVCHWCGSKDPSTVQLLIVSTNVSE